VAVAAITGGQQVVLGGNLLGLCACAVDFFRR
jgi:hypothetical protein